MPFTPFHFGVGAAFHATSPTKISFLAFCASNVVTDVEPLYYMLNGETHVHRFLHTVLGATFSWIATSILFLLLIRLGSKIRFPNWFGWRDLTSIPIALGAALGTYSHLILDGIMHSDMTPFAPFTEANPLLGIISLGALHWSCVAVGILGWAVASLRGPKYAPGVR
jgi:hypothetical protein